MCVLQMSFCPQHCPGEHGRAARDAAGLLGRAGRLGDGDVGDRSV